MLGKNWKQNETISLGLLLTKFFFLLVELSEINKKRQQDEQVKSYTAEDEWQQGLLRDTTVKQNAFQF